MPLIIGTLSISTILFIWWLGPRTSRSRGENTIANYAYRTWTFEYCVRSVLTLLDGDIENQSSGASLSAAADANQLPVQATEMDDRVEPPSPISTEISRITS